MELNPWWIRWSRICLQCRRPGFDPWVEKILWRREWQPPPVLLPGKFQGQGSLAGFSPWSHRGSYMAEVTEHGMAVHHTFSDNFIYP